MLGSDKAIMYEALFASDLQPSERLCADDVRAAITRTILALGELGCAARVAQEFGDHPDCAVARMVWARETVLGGANGHRSRDPHTSTGFAVRRPATVESRDILARHDREPETLPQPAPASRQHVKRHGAGTTPRLPNRGSR